MTYNIQVDSLAHFSNNLLTIIKIMTPPQELKKLLIKF